MPVYLNRAHVYTATTGTGTLTLGSAVPGYQTFTSAGIANGNVVSYTIEDSGSAWEVGVGTYTAAGNTLSRTLVQSSTGSLLNLTGAARVFVIMSAADMTALLTTGNIGSSVQAYDAGLQSIAGLTTSANQTIYTTGADVYVTTPLTSFGRSLIDDADAAAGRGTLGLGSIATQAATAYLNKIETYYAGHAPEGKSLANAVLQNDFANARLRGSTFTLTNWTLSNAQIDTLFDGNGTYLVQTPGALTFPVVIEFTLPKTLLYGSSIGVSFGNASWRAQSVKIETFTEGAWVTVVDTTTNTEAELIFNIPGNAAIGTTAARYTFANPIGTTSGSFRILHLWGYDYQSDMWTQLMMPRAGGTFYGAVAAPSLTLTTDLAVADGGTGASTAAAARTNLGVVIGTDVQAYDAALQSIAGLTTAANQMIYTTALDTYTTTPLTAFARTLLDDADAATAIGTLGAQAAITGAATTVTSSNLTASRALVSDVSGKIAVSTVTSTELGYLSGITGVTPRTSTTGSAALPSGTTAQRDASPQAGYFRFNNELGVFEGYSGTAWGGVGGATGGGSDRVFYENGQTVTTNYTITNGTNAMSAGPITINAGVTVTIGDGEVWTIV